MSTPLLSVTKRDLIRQTFRCGGKGGQNVNKVETGVRFIHPPSGARGEARDTRHQAQNERLAFERLCRDPLFQKWLLVESARRMGTRPIEEVVEAKVDQMMHEANLQIEYFEPNTK